ncbi:translation initiation factor IF-2 N-terminal domain-containing protein, partial [bacterium]|nr:translation initiation factor IF-2 N-terminal domain-containing protein [bacterium]
MILREKKKTKVYELSRALKLKEAELITILETLNVEGSTKFSPISDEDVDRVKSWCSEHQGPDVVEKRVGSTVRRRRRKVVEKPAPEVEVSVSESEKVAADSSTPSVSDDLTGVSSDAAVVDEAAPPVEGDPVAEVVSTEDTTSQVPEPSLQTIGVEAENVAPTAELKVDVEPSLETVVEVETDLVPESGPAVLEKTLPDVVDDPVAAPEVAVVAGEESAVAVVQDSEKEGSLPVVTTKKKKGVKEERGARVIGRVALSDLGTRPGGRPARSKPKKAETTPAGARPVRVAIPAAPATPVENDSSAKKGRKTRKKDVTPDADKGFNDSAKRTRKGSRRSVIKDFNFSEGRGKGRKGRGSKRKGGQKTEITMPKMIKRVVKITDAITVGELAKKMGVKAGEVISKLMGLGSMVTINQMIDFDTAVLVAEEYGHTVENVAFDEELVLKRTEDNPEDLQARPPVVTIMGHVDHGK